MDINELLNGRKEEEPVAPEKPDKHDEEESDVIFDENFTFEGYQVVRSEFFAHLREPSLSFSGGKVGVNTACVKRLYEVDYVQFLVNPLTKTLAIRPCSEDAKDAFLWCNERKGKRIPRTITCRLFFAKIAELMGWNPNYRYKMLGKIIKSIDEYLIIFDLTATEVYQRIEREGAKPKMSRTPIFPIEWKDQFGLPVEEHQKLLQVNIFDGYTVFGVTDRRRQSAAVNQEGAENSV